MSRIDQRAVQGHEPLSPPDAALAQRYLDHAGEITSRRERAVDRRALAWLQIVNAVATAGYLLVFAVVMRSVAHVEVQALAFVFLVWTQIVAGISQRHGMQRRLSRAQWPMIVAGSVLGAAALVVLLLSAFDPAFPEIGVVIPAAIVLVAFGGYGLILLRRASSDPRPPRPARARLDRSARAGTALVGIGIGAIIALMAAPDGVLRSAILLLILLMLIVWMCAMTSTFGLPAIGETWRWPHLSAFALGGICLAGVVLPGSPLAEAPLVPVLLGLVVAVVFTAVSFVPGFARRG